MYGYVCRGSLESWQMVHESASRCAKVHGRFAGGSAGNIVTVMSCFSGILRSVSKGEGRKKAARALRMHSR